MNIRYITTDNVSGDPGSNIDIELYRGLASAGNALIERGITEQLADLGITIDRVDHLPAEASTGDTIADLAQVNASLAQSVATAIAEGANPALIGGNCSHTIGMLAGLQQAHGATSRIGLLWLDAHGDFNTPGTSTSGMHGGMPVAVAAGLAHPRWREGAGQQTPLPTNRIVMVDVRNLDAPEEVLINSTDVKVARFGPDFDPTPVLSAIDTLAANIDLLYVHVDSDILDSSLQPNHPTAEPNGPGVEAVNAVLNHAFATGKACAFAIVSINAVGAGSETSLSSGTELLLNAMQAWNNAAR